MAIKLYKFSKWDKIPVLKEKEAIRETEHFWVFPKYGRNKEQKESKTSEHIEAFQYHYTPEEAYAAFIKYAEREIATLQNDLAIVQAALMNVKKMAGY